MPLTAMAGPGFYGFVIGGSLPAALTAKRREAGLFDIVFHYYA
jgi:hypothetical protein